MAMPYRFYTRRSAGAIGVVVESAREALAKAPNLSMEATGKVIFEDLLGNILDRVVVVTMAEIEE